MKKYHLATFLILLEILCVCACVCVVVLSMGILCTQKWWNSEGFLGEMELLITYSVGTYVVCNAYACV